MTALGRQIERWIAWVRVLAVPFAVVEVGLLQGEPFPPGYARWAWLATGVLAAGAAVFWVLSRRTLSPRRQAALGFTSLAFDTAVVGAFLLVYYSFETNTAIRQLLFLVVIEAAIKYGIPGGVALPLLLVPLLIFAERLREDRIEMHELTVDSISFPIGVLVIMGLIVGWMAQRLAGEATRAAARAVEAEGLRDQLGRRADQLDAVNRCARALTSSLDQDTAFRGFLRELQTVFEFHRVAIVLAEGDRAEVMANAGIAEKELFPEGTARPIAGSVLEHALRDGHTVVSGDMEGDPRYPEERELAAAGLRSRVVAPLMSAGAVLGIISVSRMGKHGFSREEVDLVTLLGRQVASAVENIRMYQAERRAAEELRRLSALRADFVSLVSHELRAPMAAVIGCATTLRQRWRELDADQRESFLALVEQETARLSNLVGDVLDTSRIDAGTFTYAFEDVDVAALVRDAAALASLGADEVRIATRVREPLPAVRGDRERLRQLLMNLLTNAVKYTVAGDEIEVSAHADDGTVSVSVSDHGPGIAPEQQRLVFEKFGRVNAGGRSQPGAGLGLFIARSIAEAHGGTLDLDSAEGAGATFTVRLPARDA